ncbi:NusA-like protein [Legionella beliardensis]|uniref:Ribosome maturation factor RimP n=1 Tax=Legionella beliardensis TaxID=91822 RepID=A0A378I5S9_9GAMM|nr:ribosome maturation factor RimP [Legionella beliardensis]STX30076.1 NusA-like protein [Legionella beliardensis]
MIRKDIQELIEPLVNQLGYVLWGCEYLLQGKHSLLRIYIDKENGVNITDCERVSRQVSALLDVEDPIQGHYSLEISSPGIPRPLFDREHYRQYIGSDVMLKLHKPINGKRKIKGIIQSVTNDAFTLKVNDEQYEVQFSQIVKANLIGE